MDVTITVEPFSEPLRDGYERLLPEQTDGLARGKLHWRFRDNPSAGSLFSVARDAAGTMLGINAFMALTLRLNGALITSYQSMDTIVDPICRGQGLFSKLLNSFYGAVNVGLLYGFPNGNSAHGFFNKLGWTRLGSPPFLIKPLRLGYFLKRVVGPRARYINLPLAFKRAGDETGIVTLTRFDARIDDLWASIAPAFGCAVERDAAYLNWRLMEHPEMRYSTYAIEGADGAVNAFISIIVLEKHGGRIGYVMEALARPGHDKALARLFRKANNLFITQKADAVLAWCPAHAPNYRAYRRAGFWVMPEKIRPITLHFGYRPLADTPELANLSYRDWYISYLDSDTV